MNEDRALMRFELMEALLRVAITMRDNDRQDELSPAEKVVPTSKFVALQELSCKTSTVFFTAPSVLCARPMACLRNTSAIGPRQARDCFATHVRNGLYLSSLVAKCNYGCSQTHGTS